MAADLSNVCLFLLVVSGARGAVDIMAPEIFTIGDGVIEIMCAPFNNGSGLNVVNALRISRNSSDNELGTAGSRIVSVTRTSVSVITWHNDQVRARSTVEGSVDDATAAFLRLRISSPVCQDSTTYRCEMEALDDQANSVNDDNDTSVMASVGANQMGAISVTVVSGGKDSAGLYTNDTVVRFDCSGDVGSPPANIRWCTKRDGQTNYMEVTSNVTQSLPQTDNTNCQNRRTSSFMYMFDNDDSLSEVVCEPDNVPTCGASTLKRIYALYTSQTSSSVDQMRPTLFLPLIALLLAAFL